LKIAAKPLQMETWLLRQPIGSRQRLLYPMVPSPTPYDLPFSHNTSVTDNDDRQTTTVP